jgi:hypothetical protein
MLWGQPHVGSIPTSGTIYNSKYSSLKRRSIVKAVKNKEKERLIAKFNQAIRCKHANLAPWCNICKGQDWLEAITANSKTVRQVINQFKDIESIELIEYLNKYKIKKRIKKITAIAGVTVAGGFLFYKGRKLILRLISQKRGNEKS